MNNIRSIFSIIGLAAVFLAAMAYTPQIIQISAGVVQSQKVTAPPVANDALVFFGSTGSYNIDYDRTQNRLVTVLSTDADWDMVSCGDQHCLAIKGGKLYSWGLNLNGRTGLGKGITTAATNITYTQIPTQIGSDTDWTHISAGSDHSLAIRAGRLYSFGNGANGRLGLGSTTSFDTPQQIGVDTDWLWCSAGDAWSAAIKGGQLLTCGSNANFRTGLNTSSGNTTTFTVANSDTNWTKCFAGNAHGIGIKNSPAQLWSWGINLNGRTGQNTTSGSTQVPTQVGSLTGWTTGSAGSLHSLAIRNDSLYSFGSQTNGRLGNGLISVVNVVVPALVTGTGYQDCEANGNSNAASSIEFSYAIRNDSLFATGLNARGQLGITVDTVETGTFRLVDSINFNYKKVAAGSGFGVAIRGTGPLFDLDALAYIRAVEAADGQALEPGVRTAINDFVVGCKADGIWNAIKASCILAGARTLTGALVPLRGTAPTNFNFVSGDYNRKTGLVGDGSTKYLDSNRNNNADPQNSNHNAVFISTLGNASGTYIGSGADQFNNNMARTAGNPNNMSTRSRSVNTPIVGGGIATGFVGMSRSASGSYGFRFGGVIETVSASSSAPSSNGVSVFYNPGTNSAYTNGRLAFYSIGESLDLALLDARVTALMNAIDSSL